MFITMGVEKQTTAPRESDLSDPAQRLGLVGGLACDRSIVVKRDLGKYAASCTAPAGLFLLNYTPPRPSLSATWDEG